MFVISYLNKDGNRYDVASFSSMTDATIALEGFGGLDEVMIEERNTFNPKPQDLAAERAERAAQRTAEIAEKLTTGDDDLSKIALADMSLPKVDARIDAISNLAEAKVFFKLVARYLVKRFSQL